MPNVEEEHAGDERDEGRRAEAEERPARERDGERDPRVRARARSIGEAAEHRRRERAGRAEHAEEPGGVGTEPVTGLEDEGERAPEDAERGEAERAEERRLSEHRLLARDGEERREELRIRHRVVGLAPRQEQPQRDAERDHEPGRDHVDRAPAEVRAEEAGRGAGEQDAHEEAAHHRAHRPPALLGAREVRGERHRELRHDRGRSDGERGEREERHAGRERHADERDGGGAEQREHEAPPLEDVAERHEEEHARAVAHLREHRDDAHRARRGGEGAGDRREERLEEVEVADARAGGDGEDEDGGAVGAHRAPLCTSSGCGLPGRRSAPDRLPRRDRGEQ